MTPVTLLACCRYLIAHPCSIERLKIDKVHFSCRFALETPSYTFKRVQGLPGKWFQGHRATGLTEFLGWLQEHLQSSDPPKNVTLTFAFHVQGCGWNDGPFITCGFQLPEFQSQPGCIFIKKSLLLNPVYLFFFFFASGCPFPSPCFLETGTRLFKRQHSYSTCIRSHKELTPPCSPGCCNHNDLGPSYSIVCSAWQWPSRVFSIIRYLILLAVGDRD